MKKFIIIDALAVLHRAWHALPRLATPEGKIVNAVYGFTNFILKILKEEKPEFLVVVYDTPAPCFREKEFKEYKANRGAQPQEFYDQIPLSEKVLKAFSINFFSYPGFEADDLVSTIKKKLGECHEAYQTIIFTGDRDLFQLIDKKTQVAFLKQNISQTRLYGENEINKEYQGLTPRQLIDLKALMGDQADNIPGVKGIGPKKALSLLSKYGNLENIYEAIERGDLKEKEINEKILKTLIKEKDKIILFKNLFILRSDLNLKNFRPENCRLLKFDKEEIRKIFNELGFKSLLLRLEKIETQQKALF